MWEWLTRKKARLNSLWVKNDVEIGGILTVGGEEVVPGASSSIALETPTGTVNGSNDEFEFTSAPIAVFRNGLLQDEGDDFTAAGSTITFSEAPETGDKIRGLV